jgi:hypothetical protein
MVKFLDTNKLSRIVSAESGDFFKLSFVSHFLGNQIVFASLYRYVAVQLLFLESLGY